MKIRTYDTITTRVAQLANAIPTKTENSEIALAFSTAVIDGSFGSGVTGVSQKLWDYIDYYYTISSAFPVSSVIVNIDAWNKLDPETQSTITRIAAETERDIWLEAIAMEESYNAIMREAGMNVLSPPPDVVIHFDKIGEQLASAWLQRVGEEGESILRALQYND